MRRNTYGVHKATGTKKMLKQVFEKRVSCPPTFKKQNWKKTSKFQVEFRVQWNSNERSWISDLRAKISHFLRSEISNQSISSKI